MKCQRCGRNVFNLKKREFFDNRQNRIIADVCKQCAYEIDQHHEARGSYRSDGTLHHGYRISKKAMRASREGRRQR